MGIEIGRSVFTMEEKIEFLRTLGGWLTSGGGAISVNESVQNTAEVFSRDEFRAFKGRMDKIVSDYASGQVKFYQSLKAANLGFTFQELKILEAAEESNQLRTAVPALVEALSMGFNATRSLKKQLVPLLIGGFMLILMSVGVMVFMLPTVLGPVLERQPDALEGFPFVIRWFWAASIFLRTFPAIPIVVGMIPVVIALLRNTAYMKPKVERVLMGFAPTQRLILSYNGVMIVYFMPALVRSGMPLPEVLRALAGSISNISISNALKLAANEHDSGVSLGESLSYLPLRGAFRSAVEAGEKTGAIADRVEELKVPFYNEFERVSRKMVSSLKLMVMAILMPFFIMSVYTSLAAPIFALMEF